VDVFIELAGIDALDPAADAWATGLAAEPQPVAVIDSHDLDRIALAFADFTDLKSPYLLGHSTRVAELAADAADAAGLDHNEIVDVRRAALLHDLGRVGVPNGIWDKTGPLSSSDVERVRLHAYYTERMLARSPVLAPLALVAGSHHENLDGTGYHRGVAAGQLSRPARLVRAADALQALGSERPHRPALSPADRARQLKLEVEAGRLDAEAVSAALEASGAGRVRLRPPRPAGLSDREIEVLRLLVHGLSNAEMAARLNLSAKTVSHHVQHIYDKAGVTSRAAAALFAMEAGLI
jgi:HD-GYP domain-containing protein (c-di-GMP phosphodiesterase class II)